jgi:hypothetical protein
MKMTRIFITSTPNDRKTRMKSKAFYLAGWLTLALGACSDDATSDTASSGVAEGAGQPLYVSATRVFGENDSVGYLFATPSLDADTEVDLGQAVEIDDAWVFGKADPYFYTATIFAPSITRWTVSERGEFSKGPNVDFSNEGVTGTYTAATLPLFSKNKSYFIDPGSAQVVVWDPSEMTFLRTIELDAAPIGELTPTMDLRVRGDQLVATVFWSSEDSGWVEYGDFVRVIVIDTATDEVIATHDDDRCSTISSAGPTKDGTLYFSPWDYHTVIRSVFGEEAGAASCGFRMRADETELDPDFALDLSELTGGKPTGTLQIFSDDSALLHVWQPDLVDATKENWDDTRAEAGYLWYRWNIGDDTAEPLPDQEPSIEGGEWTVLDGRNVNYAPNDEYSQTTLYELEDSGHRRQLLTVPGWAAYMIRAY